MAAAVTQLGPLGVFLLMVPESACVPVPSEVTLLAAGFSVHEGWMPFWVAVAAATAGNLVGSLIAYELGRLAAARLPGAGHGGRWARAARAGLHRSDAVLRRHGERAVFLARLMPLARTFISLPAGHARIGLVRFIAMTALGCALWAAAFVVAGALLGSGSGAVAGQLGLPLLALGAIIVCAVLVKTDNDASA